MLITDQITSSLCIAPGRGVFANHERVRGSAEECSADLLQRRDFLQRTAADCREQTLGLFAEEGFLQRRTEELLQRLQRVQRRCSASLRLGLNFVCLLSYFLNTNLP